MKGFGKQVLAAVIFLAAAGQVHAQKVHPCAKDAVTKGNQLLKLHFTDGVDDRNFKATVGSDVKVLAPVKALKGNGRFDVLEVWGAIYKAEYRMRFIYAQIKDSCVLMGQEIIEASDPY